MICACCGGHVTWRGPLSNLTHTECASCGAVNAQLVDQAGDATEMVDELPEGLRRDESGAIEFQCRSCGQWAEWPGEPEDFEFDAPENLCGGSPRCLP
ncbi:hypothetical protein I5E68_06955 [Novosphingobium sp. YJ-S2-02]|uniref:Uncharacterized protein n=1 Tax=Novosphingobium aureum TaxID=2792964 RepID=A0A931MKD3_9SPHN|nr:hypothetical protein [Novosphingobium aureum]MBH0112688.1 hypothetical protein [Novosphingobium aureum]